MYIAKSHSLEKKMLQLCHEIISGKFNIYVLGTNIWANDIINKLDVVGVIDEYSNQTEFNRKPIFHNINTLNKTNDLIISCNVLGRPWTVKQKLDSIGINNIDYFSFWKFSNLDLIDNRGWNEFQTLFNIEKYTSLFNTLEDIESKRTLENVVNFRLTQDLSFMKFYADRQLYQYFEPFLNLSTETFIDIGGFDGLTSLQFANYCDFPSGILFFEPEEKNMSVAKNKLANLNCKVDFFKLGVGNKKQELKFSQNGSSSSIDENGDQIIKIDTIDNILKNFPDNNRLYIKMDIEGWELNALEGAKETIKNKAPKMAICVYHKPNDFIHIYDFIISIQPKYKVYLRHYTEGEVETVMYFVPLQ